MSKDSRSTVKVVHDYGLTGCLAVVTWFGAFIYFLQGAKTFGDWLWAFVEACVWPGILVYHLLKVLGA